MKLTLKDRWRVAEKTMAFSFVPERSIEFVAGQFADFTLVNPPWSDDKGNTRSFSFASAPENPEIIIATRMRDSAFKRCLREAPFGTVVELTGPMGGFTLHSDASRPAVFLTGGIGITPVRSIVEHATQRELPHRLFVFYSNRSRAAAPFVDDFDGWSRRNPNLRVIETLTDERPANWTAELGFIDEAMLARYLPDLAAPIYYVVGPPAMVSAMKSLLATTVVGEAEIRSEDFAGY